MGPVHSEASRLSSWPASGSDSFFVSLQRKTSPIGSPFKWPVPSNGPSSFQSKDRKEKVGGVVGDPWYPSDSSWAADRGGKPELGQRGEATMIPNRKPRPWAQREPPAHPSLTSPTQMKEMEAQDLGLCSSLAGPRPLLGKAGVCSLGALPHSEEEACYHLLVWGSSEGSRPTRPFPARPCLGCSEHGILLWIFFLSVP